MTRYYFHIRDGEFFIPDEEGLELMDMAAARSEGLLSAQDLVGATVSGEYAIDSRSIEIADDMGVLLGTIPVRRVLH